MHLVRDVETLLRHREIGDLAMQMRVVDGDGRLHGEALQRFFIALGEQTAVMFFAQI